MTSSAQMKSLRVRASAEAFEILRGSKSPKIPNAELLKHAVRSDHEPHPRVVREVHQALLAVREAQPKETRSTFKKISGIFSRRPQPEASSLDEVIQRFEKAFVQPN